MDAILTFLGGMFAVGTFWFWALAVIYPVSLFYMADDDQWGWATFWTLAVMGMLSWMGDVPVYQVLWAGKWLTLAGIAAYGFVGGLWAIGKWWFFVRHNRSLYEEHKDDISTDDKQRVSNGDSFKICLDWTHIIYVRPKPGDFSDKIYGWIVFWPISFVWTIVNDPVKKFFKAIYRGIVTTLQRISNKAWNDA